jgi:HEAT repeat protein
MFAFRRTEQSESAKKEREKQMTKLHLMAFLLLFVIFGATHGSALNAIPLRADECHEAAALIRDLHSKYQRKRERTKKSVLLLAARSSGSRRCVIDKTLTIVSEVSNSPDKSAALSWNSGGRFQEWSAAAEILGTLKASEAMDPLIDCLDCSDGRVGLGVGRFPATKAILKFGVEAIPKLEAALHQKPPGIRAMAAQALHAIGGEKARSILQEALSKETDRYVADTIRNMLLSWNVSIREKT